MAAYQPGISFQGSFDIYVRLIQKKKVVRVNVKMNKKEAKVELVDEHVNPSAVGWVDYDFFFSVKAVPLQLEQYKNAEDKFYIMARTFRFEQIVWGKELAEFSEAYEAWYHMYGPVVSSSESFFIVEMKIDVKDVPEATRVCVRVFDRKAWVWKSDTHTDHGSPGIWNILGRLSIRDVPDASGVQGIGVFKFMEMTRTVDCDDIHWDRSLDQYKVAYDSWYRDDIAKEMPPLLESSHASSSSTLEPKPCIERESFRGVFFIDMMLSPKSTTYRRLRINTFKTSAAISSYDGCEHRDIDGDWYQCGNFAIRGFSETKDCCGYIKNSGVIRFLAMARKIPCNHIMWDTSIRSYQDAYEACYRDTIAEDLPPPLESSSEPEVPSISRDPLGCCFLHRMKDPTCDRCKIITHTHSSAASSDADIPSSSAPQQSSYGCGRHHMSDPKCDRCNKVYRVYAPASSDTGIPSSSLPDVSEIKPPVETDYEPGIRFDGRIIIEMKLNNKPEYPIIRLNILVYGHGATIQCDQPRGFIPAIGKWHAFGQFFSLREVAGEEAMFLRTIAKFLIMSRNIYKEYINWDDDLAEFKNAYNQWNPPYLRHDSLPPAPVYPKKTTPSVDAPATISGSFMLELKVGAQKISSKVLVACYDGKVNISKIGEIYTVFERKWYNFGATNYVRSVEDHDTVSVEKFFNLSKTVPENKFNWTEELSQFRLAFHDWFYALSLDSNITFDKIPLVKDKAKVIRIRCTSNIQWPQMSRIEFLHMTGLAHHIHFVVDMAVADPALASTKVKRLLFDTDYTVKEVNILSPHVQDGSAWVKHGSFFYVRNLVGIETFAGGSLKLKDMANAVDSADLEWAKGLEEYRTAYQAWHVLFKHSNPLLQKLSEQSVVSSSSSSSPQSAIVPAPQKLFFGDFIDLVFDGFRPVPVHTSDYKKKGFLFVKPGRVMFREGDDEYLSASNFDKSEYQRAITDVVNGQTYIISGASDEDVEAKVQRMKDYAGYISLFN
jgi:hypothetical protein